MTLKNQNDVPFVENFPICLFYLLILIYFKVPALSYSCNESAGTVRPVDRCPKDSKSWEIAAKNMRCDAIKQNCSQSSSRRIFQYHCVINAWMNETLEMCAPNRTIFGMIHVSILWKKNPLYLLILHDEYIGARL